MIKKLDLNDQEAVKSILRLQKKSYQIEADLLGFQELPPLKDTFNSIQESNEIFYGYFKEEVLVGMIAYKREKDVVDIHRVAVDPCFFKLGIASQLLDSIEVIEDSVYKIIVSTGSLNKPAIHLYKKKGFREIGIVNKEIFITLFEKKI